MAIEHAFRFNGISTKKYETDSMNILEFMKDLAILWIDDKPIESFNTSLGTIYKIRVKSTNQFAYGLVLNGDASVSAILKMTAGTDDGLVEYTFVLPRFIGKGLGSLLYKTVLKDVGTLRSSDNLSVGSSKAWKNLCQKYKGQIIMLMNNGKEQVVDIHGWTDFKKFTVPIVRNTEGQLVNLGTLIGNPSRRPSDERSAAISFVYRIRNS
jgi:hypothetical protein